MRRLWFSRETWFRNLILLSAIGTAAFADTASAGDANRLTYLDDFCEPYYVHREFPKLITPQWVGEAGVECVVTLGIDDMREAEPYERFLRPILDRLKQIDGRAPVSMMTNDIDPQHPHLQQWLKEGLSIETHTADHPCPCLQGGRLEEAKSTYDRCVEQIAAIPNNRPVAFRFPCMDSLNTPSPRAYTKLFNSLTPEGNFLQISSSVCALLTPDDMALRPELTFDANGRERFGKYLPFPSFVNKVENYPYPYVIGRLCWEFPCAVPDDWQGFHLQQACNPKTLEDFQAFLDAAVVKQGTMNIVFHPHGWISSEQMVALVDYAQRKHGEKIKFLNFSECLQRLNANLLAGQPLRSESGEDNGVRILDVNDDGYVDVIIGNERLQKTRIWSPEKNGWIDGSFPAQLVRRDSAGKHSIAGLRLGIVGDSRRPVCLVRDGQLAGAWRWNGDKWVGHPTLLNGLELDGEPIFTSLNGLDLGVRLRDLDGDGCCELIVSNPKQNAVFGWREEKGTWIRLPFGLPPDVQFVNGNGKDAGLRLVDIDDDKRDDIVFSNEHRYSVHRFADMTTGWSDRRRSGRRGDGNSIPMISRGGANNGAWFAGNSLWVQNEDTSRLPDGVDRCSFIELQNNRNPPPRSPEHSLASFRVWPGYRVEAVATEPLVMDPIAFDWGADGKLWVVEMADYPLGLDDKGKPGGRVRYLEDTDNDGRYDKSTLFLDGIPFPTGAISWRSGVLVSAAPDVFYAEDTDGDGKADKREVLYTGFGEGNQQHRVNGFWRGLDNWLYLANGDSNGEIRSIKTGATVDIRGKDLRIRPDDGGLEAQSGMTQFGRTRDDWGNWFGCTNSEPLFHFALDDHYLRRNPHLRAPNSKVRLATLESEPIYPIGRVLSHWSGYRPPPLGQPSRFTSAGGLTIYRDEILGPRFNGAALVSEPIHNLIHSMTLTSQGTAFSAEATEGARHREFLASSDSWFRPTSLRTGPDGALWVADMYRLVLEHPEWIDDEEEKKLDLRAGHDRGRIYRIVPLHGKLRPVPRLSLLNGAEIVALLESPNGTQRDLAQQWLVERRDHEEITQQIVPLLKAMVAEGKSPLARLHALCTLDGIESLGKTILLRALADKSAGVRRHAVRLSEPRLEQWPELVPPLLNLVGDDDAQVRLQLAYTLGQWKDSCATDALSELLQRDAQDRYLPTAVLSSLDESNIGDVLEKFLADGGIAEKDAEKNDTIHVLEQLVEQAVAMGKPEAVAGVLALATKTGEGKGAATWQMSLVATAIESLARQQLTLEKVARDETRERLPAVFSQAQKVAGNESADEADRLAAIRLLGQRSTYRAESDFFLKLMSPANSPAVQAAAIRALARIEQVEAVPKTFLSRWREFSPSSRSQMLDVLVSRTVWIEQLLEAMECGDVSVAEIDALHRQQIVSVNEGDLRKQAESLFAASTAGRGDVLKDYQQALARTGNAKTGRSVFAKQCAVCHRLDNVGVEVGASLLNLNNRSPEALLTAILDPNRAVEDKFISYTVITHDGRILNGIIASEAGNNVTLRGQEGKETVVPRSEIDTLRSSSKSLMPEGLEKVLTQQDVADLIAYLSATLAPPLADKPG